MFLEGPLDAAHLSVHAFYQNMFDEQFGSSSHVCVCVLPYTCNVNVNLEHFQMQKDCNLSRNPAYWSGRVALLGLGVPAAAVAQCKQYVVQIPGEAEAALHKLRTKLAGSFPRALPQGLSQALDSLQVNPMQIC